MFNKAHSQRHYNCRGVGRCLLRVPGTAGSSLQLFNDFQSLYVKMQFAGNVYAAFRYIRVCFGTILSSSIQISKMLMKFSGGKSKNSPLVASPSRRTDPQGPQQHCLLRGKTPIISHNIPYKGVEPPIDRQQNPLFIRGQTGGIRSNEVILGIQKQ